MSEYLAKFEELVLKVHEIFEKLGGVDNPVAIGFLCCLLVFGVGAPITVVSFVGGVIHQLVDSGQNVICYTQCDGTDTCIAACKE